MSTWMKLLLGLVVLVCIAAAVVALVFRLTAGVTDGAGQFFSLVRDGKLKEAYLATAQEFRATTSEQQFQAFLSSSALADFDRASWNSRSVTNSVGELEGSVTTRQKGVIPIKMKLVKEAGVWRVLSLEKATAGIVSGAEAPAAIGSTGAPAVPGGAELVSMANVSVLSLARAVNARDFGAFYQASAKLWQGQTTPDALKTSFQTFIDKNLDLTIVDGKTPDFSQPAAIDDKGRLVLKGLYPLPSVKVEFSVSFIREEQQWKLVGINVATRAVPPSAPGVMPAPDALEALVNGAVSGLADAIARDDFADFHKSTSIRWQAQISVPDIRKAFSSFIDKKIPLNVIDGKRPEFTDAPKIDENGVLVLVGQYPGEPYAVIFNLAFRNEDGQWKLQGVDVHTKRP